ncbi:MAG: tetratricopeptide repeat protein [Bacteroidales bacterium]|nr:tetratricopeptide repeat protein [Bacteroidales bacterium]
MSTNKKVNQTDKGFQDVEMALTRSEQFIEKNQKGIAIGAIAVLAVIAIIWFVNTLYIAPNKVSAQEEIFNAQYYFEQDSFRLALDGDGMNAGFLKIIDEYGSTPAGNLASYYAGVCYLNLGEYENAKKYLKAFSTDDATLSSQAIGLAGDAECQLGNEKEAIAAYKKAIEKKDNVTAPIFLMKLGALYESTGNTAEAKKCYQEVKDNYATSLQATTAEKYLSSVE